jgi:hypothetical protein
MLRNLNTIRGGLRPMYRPATGVLGSLIPATVGSAGQSILYPQLVLPGDATSEFSYWVESLGTMPAGFWPLDDDGTGTRGPYADGVYTSSVALYRWDVRQYAFTVTLTQGTPSTAPVVTLQPSSVSVLAGASPAFSSTASGSPTPTGQWESSTDMGSTWAAVSGATGNTLTLTNVQDADTGQLLRRAYSNGVGGTVYSSVATLTVSLAWQAALNIYTLLAPFDQVDNLGGFAKKDPAARVTLAFEFKRFTASPQSVAVSIARRRGAADATPGAVLLGSAAILGTKVFQRVQGGVGLCDYVVRAELTAVDGSVYVLEGVLPVRTG